MVTVYKYKVYKLSNDSYVLSEHYATEKFIKAIDGAVMIIDSKLAVEERRLDGNGRIRIDTLS